MDSVDGGFVRARWNDTINEVGLDQVANFRLKSLLHTPWAWREIDHSMRRVIRLLRPSEILRREQLKMVANREHIRLGMKVIDGRGVVAAGDEPEGAVLHRLEATDGQLIVERIYNRRRVVEERSN